MRYLSLAKPGLAFAVVFLVALDAACAPSPPPDLSTPSSATADGTAAQERTEEERLRRQQQNRANRQPGDRASAQRGNRRDVTRGDSGNDRAFVPGIQIPTQLCPEGEITVTARDGKKFAVPYRKPVGDGPFPTLVLTHGGTHEALLSDRKEWLRSKATYTHFLAKGYVVFAATFRDFESTIQSEDPSYDLLSIVNAVREQPFVDKKSVVQVASSGGGTKTFDVLSQMDVACFVAMEPATVIFTGIMQELYSPNRRDTMQNPHKYYTDEMDKRVRSKLKNVTAPIVFVQGTYMTTVINDEIIKPRLDELGKKYTSLKYNVRGHGFYWGTTESATPALVQQVVDDVAKEINKYIAVQPLPLAAR